MQEIWMRFEWDMHVTCQRFVWDMSEICLKYAWDLPDICLKNAIDIPDIRKGYAWDIPNICMRYTWDMREICPRFAWHMLKIWFVKIPERSTLPCLTLIKQMVWLEADGVWPSEWVSDEAATRDAYASKNNNKDNNIPDFGHTLKLGFCDRQ